MNTGRAQGRSDLEATGRSVAADRLGRMAHGASFVTAPGGSRWVAGVVEANGIWIGWTRTGGDLPQLVLVHGFTDDGGCWAPFARAIEVEWDVVMLDARGHGRSDAPTDGYTPLTFACDILAACDALGVERPMLAGHSMGAVTALLAAACRPGWARGVIAEDPPPWWSEAAYSGRPRSADALRLQIVSRRALARPALRELGRAEGPRWSDPELDAWVEAKLRVDPASAALYKVGWSTSVEWARVLRAIDVPVLVVGADPAEGSALSEAAALALLDAVPHARLVRVPGAGHSIRRDEPGAYLRIVRDELSARR